MHEHEHRKKTDAEEEEILNEEKEELDDALDPELIKDLDRDRGGFFAPAPETLRPRRSDNTKEPATCR